MNTQTLSPSAQRHAVSSPLVSSRPTRRRSAAGSCGASALLGLMLTAVAVGCGPKRETFVAHVSYVLDPKQSLPEGLYTVAVLDSDAEVAGTEPGYESDDEQRAKKWSTIAADMMEHMLLQAGQEFGSRLTVAKRRDTRRVLAEHDLKAAGLVDAGTAMQAAKLLNVQALISSKLNIRIDIKKSKTTMFDLSDLAGGGGRGVGGGYAHIRAREIDKVTRNTTVQCTFSMIDAGNGSAIVQYAPRPIMKKDSKGGGVLFGRSRGEADLDSVDEYIGELVEVGVREFVGTFIPQRFEIEYKLRSAKSEASARAIRMLRADEFQAAMEEFQAALRDEKDANSDEVVFAMGVTSELMSDWESALKYYRQAAAMPGVDSDDLEIYQSAKQRVLDHKDRIRRTQSPGAMQQASAATPVN